MNTKSDKCKVSDAANFGAITGEVKVSQIIISSSFVFVVLFSFLFFVFFSLAWCMRLRYGRVVEQKSHLENSLSNSDLSLLHLLMS